MIRSRTTAPLAASTRSVPAQRLSAPRTPRSRAPRITERSQFAWKPFPRTKPNELENVSPNEANSLGSRFPERSQCVYKSSGAKSFTRSHGLRGNAVLDALRPHWLMSGRRRASKTAFPRRPWERGETCPQRVSPNEANSSGTRFPERSQRGPNPFPRTKPMRPETAFTRSHGLRGNAVLHTRRPQFSAPGRRGASKSAFSRRPWERVETRSQPVSPNEANAEKLRCATIEGSLIAVARRWSSSAVEVPGLELVSLRQLTAGPSSRVGRRHGEEG